MTPKDVSNLSDIVTKAKAILGSIHVVNEQLAWLKADATLYLAFDRGASTLGNTTAQRVQVHLPSHVQDAISDLVAMHLQSALVEHQTALANLTIALENLPP